MTPLVVSQIAMEVEGQLSKYTTEIRYLCESYYKNEPGGFNDVDNIIQAAIPHIFDFDFPMFDPSYKNVLCTKILRHFYTREIGSETVGLWKLRLQTKLNEIMPYYNLLYKAGIDKFNPLWDTQLTTEYEANKQGKDDETEKVSTDVVGKQVHEQTVISTEKDTINKRDVKDNTAKSTGTSEVSQKTDTTTTQAKTVDGEKVDKYSETPQGGLNGIIDDNYLTNARIVDNIEKTDETDKTEASGEQTGKTVNDYTDKETLVVNQENNKTGDKTDKGTQDDTKHEDIGRTRGFESKTTEDYVLKISGRRGGSVLEALEAFRSEFLNIDMLIIKELESLFMQIW